MRCMPLKKHTNEVYAANEPNFLGPKIYGTQQVESQYLIAYHTWYILTSVPVLYGDEQADAGRGRTYFARPNFQAQTWTEKKKIYIYIYPYTADHKQD